MSPTLQARGWLIIGFRERCASMRLCALVNLELWQFTSVSLPLSLSHTLTNTHSPCFCTCQRTQGVYSGVCSCEVSVCIEGRDFFCVYPGHIVWTGKMRMDGIVITEWRYPHSVKLEKAGRKPPTGTAGKERVVVMVIGEFKQGFANLQGKRCECVRVSFSSMCVGWFGVCLWIFFLWKRREKLLWPWWRLTGCCVFNFSTFKCAVILTWAESGGVSPKGIISTGNGLYISPFHQKLSFVSQLEWLTQLWVDENAHTPLCVVFNCCCALLLMRQILLQAKALQVFFFRLSDCIQAALSIW